MSHDFQMGCDRNLYDWEGDECEKCGGDLIALHERDCGICDDCAYKETQETIKRLKEGRNEI